MQYEKQIAPVGIVFYRRFEKINLLLDSLRDNVGSSNTEIFIFSDGANSIVEQVDIDWMRAELKKYKGFNKINVIEHSANLGREKNAKFAVEYLREIFPFFILMEDDLLVSPQFLKFMNHCFINYFDDEKVQTVGGYNAPFNLHNDGLVKHKILNAWGIGFWSHKRFITKLFEKKNFYYDMVDSGSLLRVLNVHMYLVIYLRGMGSDVRKGDYIGTYLNCKYDWVQIRPFRSTVLNRGFDGSGENCGINNSFQQQAFINQPISNELIAYDLKHDKSYKSYFNIKDKTVLQNCRRQIIQLTVFLLVIILTAFRWLVNLKGR